MVPGQHSLPLICPHKIVGGDWVPKTSFNVLFCSCSQDSTKYVSKNLLPASSPSIFLIPEIGGGTPSCFLHFLSATKAVGHSWFHLVPISFSCFSQTPLIPPPSLYFRAKNFNISLTAVCYLTFINYFKTMNWVH